jgi:hypothetical protein
MKYDFAFFADTPETTSRGNPVTKLPELPIPLFPGRKK